MADDAATRIHIIDDTLVWLDTDVGEEDGICIGVGNTRDEAIADAISELHSRLFDLEVLLRGPAKNDKHEPEGKRVSRPRGAGTPYR